MEIKEKYDKKVKERYLPEIQSFIFHQGIVPSIFQQKYDQLCKIVFLNKGKGTFIVDGFSYEVKDGAMLICNPGCIHSETYHTSSEVYVLHMNNIFLGGLEENFIVHENRSPVIETKPYTEEFHLLLRFIYEE
jgi:hypothetical protein